ARLEDDRPAHVVAARLFERQRGPQRPVAERPELDVLLDPDREPRALQVRPGPVRGELERAVEGERIDGPCAPRRVPDPVARYAGAHGADDALGSDLLDGDDAAEAWTMESIAAIKLVERHRELGRRRCRRSGKGGGERGGDVGAGGG